LSTYENYDRISATYDHTRRAFGLNQIRTYVAHYIPQTPRRLGDIGCGTGNFTAALRDLAPYVVGCDLSIGMLSVAKTKVSPSGPHCLVNCDIGKGLPFRSETFDILTCMQVVHHLDFPGTGYPRHRCLFSEIHRVLVCGGLLILNTISHDQLRDGVWWGELIAPAVDRMIPRFSTISELSDMMASEGLDTITVEPFRDATTQNEEYFDYAAIRSQHFRNGDSHFSLLTPGELENALVRLDDLERSGAIHSYMKERDLLRRELGQSTFVVAKKRSLRP
jgi:ubiquinone/menaquinone biosynthesis C-methylase UbiE